MNFEIESYVKPLPSEILLDNNEKFWKVSLPLDFRQFMMKYNGCIPKNRQLKINNHEYFIERFLCILDDPQENDFGMYDVDVVWSQLDERLFFHDDILGVELLPIAILFAGDFICLDFSQDRLSPSICIWYHEESYELEPSIQKVADSFSEFLEMLY
jgi:hypothetical protein